MNRWTHAAFLAALAIAQLPISLPASAAEHEAAVNRVRTSVDEFLEVLRDPKMQGKELRAERHGRLRSISDKVFDWGAMAQKSLGVHWRKLDEAERKRFTTTFKELLANYYLTQIDRFQGKEQVVFDGTQKNSDGVEVRMNLVTAGGETVPLHFFMNQAERIVDVSIEGVSIANHYRGSFDRLLVNGTFEDMMKKLEQKRSSGRAAKGA